MFSREEFEKYLPKNRRQFVVVNAITYYRITSTIKSMYDANLFTLAEIYNKRSYETKKNMNSVPLRNLVDSYILKPRTEGQVIFIGNNIPYAMAGYIYLMLTEILSEACDINSPATLRGMEGAKPETDSALSLICGIEKYLHSIKSNEICCSQELASFAKLLGHDSHIDPREYIITNFPYLSAGVSRERKLLERVRDCEIAAYNVLMRSEQSLREKDAEIKSLKEQIRQMHIIPNRKKRNFGN